MTHLQHYSQGHKIGEPSDFEGSPYLCFHGTLSRLCSHATGSAKCRQNRTDNRRDDLQRPLDSFLLCHSLPPFNFQFGSILPLIVFLGVGVSTALVATLVTRGRAAALTVVLTTLILILLIGVLDVTAVARGHTLQHVALFVQTSDLD